MNTITVEVQKPFSSHLRGDIFQVEENESTKNLLTYGYIKVFSLDEDMGQDVIDPAVMPDASVDVEEESVDETDAVVDDVVVEEEKKSTKKTKKKD